MKPLLSLFLLLGWMAAQCPHLFPPPPSCDACIPLSVGPSGNATIPNNQVRCVPSNASVTITNLTVGNNATLIVCGSLTVQGDLNLNNGASVWVAPSGALHVQGITVGPNSSLVNFGVVSASQIALNGGGASLWNIGTGAQIQVSGSIQVNASSQFINHAGLVQANNLTLNGTAQACLSNGACLSLNSFTANGNGAIQVTGSSPVALTFTGQATLNSQVTNSSLLHVCQGPSATTNNPSNWGAAQVTTGCTSGCNLALSILQLEVEGQKTQSEVYLNWFCRGLHSSSHTYEVQVWDGKDFLRLALTSDNHVVVSTAILPPLPKWIFRVKLLGPRGEVLAEGQILLSGEVLSFRAWPTFFSECIRYAYAGEESAVAFLHDAAGRQVARFIVEPGTGAWFTDAEGRPLANFPQGVYLLSLYTINGAPLGAVHHFVK
ncbi:MAG: hypothetical protein N2170_07700 [Bacteroidia bacterium]|nr:hypothetical protein [Bacteroidia bacterium]